MHLLVSAPGRLSQPRALGREPAAGRLRGAVGGATIVPLPNNPSPSAEAASKPSHPDEKGVIPAGIHQREASDIGGVAVGLDA